MKHIISLSVILASAAAFAAEPTCNIAIIQGGTPVQSQSAILKSDEPLVLLTKNGEFTAKIRYVDTAEIEGLSMTLTKGEVTSSALFGKGDMHPFQSLHIGVRVAQVQCWL